MRNLEHEASDALKQLVGLKDPEVFKTPQGFEKHLRTLLSENCELQIQALKAGLTERFPWTMHKEPSGILPQSLCIQLSKTLTDKYSIESSQADWAVKCWAESLQLSIEIKQSLEDKAPQKSHGSKEPHPFYAISRMGIIYAVDSDLNPQVYKCWYSTESPQGIFTPTIIKQKINESKQLFEGAMPIKKAPKPKKTDSKSNSPQLIKPNKKKNEFKKPQTPKAAAKGIKSTKSVEPASDNINVKNADPKTLFIQACQLLPGKGRKHDMPRAIKLLTHAAKGGSIESQRVLGEIFLKGVGVKQDFKAAAGYLLASAQSGDPEAQFHLASLYQCGMGVEYDLNKALWWLKKANAQGHEEAATMISEISQMLA